MTGPTPPGRRFLFLQGPHGPFFRRLSQAVAAAGGQCWRVGFTFGDRAFWHDSNTYIPFRGDSSGWPSQLSNILDGFAITDLVLYGDIRPVHATAIRIARARGLTVHVFEEGYLRPFWATYERDGANGNSALMDLGLPEIAARHVTLADTAVEAPAHWGDLRQHILYGALYHALVLAGRRAYPGYRPHRGLSLWRELRLYLQRIALWPAHAVERRLATARVLSGGFPYHLCLLQLDHDSNFRAHSPFDGNAAFVAEVIRGFAAGAPAHHHLVFKAHPLEDGRIALPRVIRAEAQAACIAARVHFVRGGKLARLLDGARSAVTVNSTAAQQALWRGKPVRIFGAAVYGKPGLVSSQPLPAFFADPTPPDRAAYGVFRQFLLETSQLPGGYYSARGRRQLLRAVVDRMLAPTGPYERADAAHGQHLRLMQGGLEAKSWHSAQPFVNLPR